MRELRARLTLSRSTIEQRVKVGDFPSPIRLTPTRIAWRETDVNQWLAQKSNAR